MFEPGIYVPFTKTGCVVAAIGRVLVVLAQAVSKSKQANEMRCRMAV
jgi:hypothetical protein